LSRKHAALRARRERLIALAARQREDMARQLTAWRGPLALADRALAWLDAWKRHAPVLGLGLAALVAARRLDRVIHGLLAILRYGRPARRVASPRSE
jgi:hypothetical protein